MRRVSSWRAVFAAEALRVKGSALMWLPVLGLPLAALSHLLSLHATPGDDARSVLAWQSMYLTGMAAPIMGLFAAVAEHRERAARGGGVAWRPVSARRIRTGRLLAVTGAVAVFHVLNFGGTWLVALAGACPGAARILLVGALAFLGALPVVGLGSALARRSGTVATVIVLAVWQLVGTLTAEESRWWLFPPAWPVRLILAPTGIHANAVPLAPGDPLAQEQPWPALGLCLLLGVVTVGWAVTGAGLRLPTPRRSPGSGPSALIERRRADPAPVAPRGRAGLGTVLRAVNAVLLPSGLGWLLPATAAVLILCAVIYPPAHVHGFHTFALLPLGAGLLPVLAWRLLARAWAVMVLANHRVRAALLLWHLAVIAAMSLVAGLCGLLAGGDPVDELRRWVLSTVTGTVLALLALALTVRFGAGVGVFAAVVWTVVSATLGGDVLAATTLWLVALPSWAETATDPARVVTALVAGCALAVAGGTLAVAAVRRVERAS